ncbi:MAG: TonB-dependent receptor plug domain-containing protein [Alphaproteobacteria bacterium]|nr:TonB-dependent receptor plug domain-containing protein [Alphaproteobacteria bacterium]MDE2630729.1 TonB-dependent receptor plug domain-containing protein [Alphaproteobacteria bacterium]
MASAFTVPAYAQIETVVVTAEKKAENVQSVPISLTALTGEDLSSRQINTFQDLQFNVPSVTNTKTNFTSSNLEIRGIGSSGTGAAAESGVAFNVNDYYLNSPAIAEAEYYDVERIEVLRGPQSTLYGRNATGGSVNVISAKPDLEAFSFGAEGEYGNYNDMKLKATINIPVVADKLAVRVSGLWWNRDGTTTNLYDNRKVDSRNQWSVRGSVRIEPTSDTTIDLMLQASNEDSTRMRSQKTMCDFDPSGVLGCLPDKLAFNTPNLNSTLGNILASPQIFAGFFKQLPAGLQGYYNTIVAPSLGVAPAPGLTAGQTLFAALGLGQANLSGAQASGFNPTDMHQINSDFDPKYHANELLAIGQWKQRLNDWLDMTLLVGYQHAGVASEQSYYNLAGAPIIYSAQQIGLINGMAAPLCFGQPCNTAPRSNFGLMHPTSIGGGLYTLAVPVSAYFNGDSGTIGGHVQRISNLNSISDHSSGSGVQKSAELRFNSNLSGPVNFLLAGYYLSYDNKTDYLVAGAPLDYASLMIGALALPVTPLLAGSTPGVPMAVGPGFYWNAETYTLTSKAAFGEIYYDAIPDLLKFTGGLRYTEDDKALTGRTTLFNAFVPMGTTNLDSPVPYIATTPFGAFVGPAVSSTKLTKNTAVTGRFVANFTPKLDFTDQTLLYASYSRGYKAGGTNPPLPSDAPPSLNSYQPEFVNAYELGTKNLLLGGNLQANADVWYYDYKGLQVAAILDKTAINENVDATMWGVEGEFLWAPDDRWQLNMSVATNHSDIGNSSLIDSRNPTNGDPNATLIKDLGSAENCVVTHDTGYPVWSTVAAATPNPVIAPNGGYTGTPGVADSGYSSCANIPAVIAALPFIAPALAGHYHYYPSGESVSLKGNSLQNMPTGSIGFGAQYTQPLDGGFSLLTRVDGYWQSDMWGTIFNLNPIDRIQSYFLANAQMQLNSPGGNWYVRAFVNNMFDKNYVTGMYVSDPSTGLFTNEFVGQPRTYGVLLGVKL